jgi:cell wall-associated NlpC family hydrolase
MAVRRRRGTIAVMSTTAISAAATNRVLRIDERLFAAVLLLVLAGCASHRPAPSHYGAQAAAVAQDMVGVKYRYGGESPSGFDCSGLAFYAYQRAGLTIPRSSTAQQRAARPIEPSQASAGDLLFFDMRWNRHHVGIYLGKGRFVHAPSRGKKVSIESLDDGYFAKRLKGVGRFN